MWSSLFSKQQMINLNNDRGSKCIYEYWLLSFFKNDDGHLGLLRSSHWINNLIGWNLQSRLLSGVYSLRREPCLLKYFALCGGHVGLGAEMAEKLAKFLEFNEWPHSANFADVDLVIRGCR